MTPKGRLMVIRRPYSAGLDKKTDNACKNRFDPKTLSSFILLNSYVKVKLPEDFVNVWLKINRCQKR